MRTIAVTLATSALLLGTASEASAAKKVYPNEKSTVTDIQWRISYGVQNPGNCMVVGFSQWEAAKFKGWEAYKLSMDYNGTTYSPPLLSPPPLYDDQLQYQGNTVSPPNGSHWLLIGDGSFRAGAPPALFDCQAMLAKSRSFITNNKVTTYYRRSSLCVTKLDKLLKAQKALDKAEGRKARQKARGKLDKAKASFNKDCSK